MICGIKGCTQEYRVYNWYYCHMKRCHSSDLISRTCTRPRGGAVGATGDSAQVGLSSTPRIEVRERYFETFDVPIQSGCAAGEPNVNVTPNIPDQSTQDEAFNSAMKCARPRIVRPRFLPLDRFRRIGFPHLIPQRSLPRLNRHTKPCR